MDKKSYQEAAKKRIDELYAQLDKFNKKKNQISEDLRAEYESRSLAIKAGIEELEMGLQTIEDATEDKWGEVKKTFHESADSFKEGFSKLGSLFK